MRSGMRMECFCGCGRELSGTNARISASKGALVVQLLDGLERFTVPLLIEGSHPDVVAARENVASLITDGEALRDDLAALVHDELSARGFDRRGMKSWIKTASKIARRSLDDIQRELARQAASESAL